MMQLASERSRRDSESTLDTSRWSEASNGDCDGDGDGDDPSRPRSGSETNLSMLHACVHCRASKTACTDQRPCARCCRLGLDCASDGSQPRKRACRSCHAAKVACGAVFGDTCNRCRRLGLECVPRDPPAQGGPRRKRAGKWSVSVLDADADAQHLQQQHEPPHSGGALPGHLAPLDLTQLSSVIAAAADGGASASSPGAVSSMFSVAASLLDLSRLSRPSKCARPEGAASMQARPPEGSPRMVGAAASLGALGATPRPSSDATDEEGAGTVTPPPPEAGGLGDAVTPYSSSSGGDAAAGMGGDGRSMGTLCAMLNPALAAATVMQ